MTFAAIDIGTNAILLLVAQWKKTGIEVLWDEARITRLGESLHKFRLFIPEARKRTLEVLRDYRRICDSFHVTEIAAVGTAAFRKAENAGEFIEEIFAETGIRIEIVAGSREAELSFRSVKADFGNFPNLIALDIGGGVHGDHFGKGGREFRYRRGDPPRGDGQGGSPHGAGISRDAGGNHTHP